MLEAQLERLLDVFGTACVAASGISIHDNRLEPDDVVGLRTLLHLDHSIADPLEEL